MYCIIQDLCKIYTYFQNCRGIVTYKRYGYSSMIVNQYLFCQEVHKEVPSYISLCIDVCTRIIASP